jgi:hypothetical protein
MKVSRLFCVSAAALASLVLVACGGHHGGNGDDAGGDDSGIDGHDCVGLECFQVDCPSGGTTSVSGTVYMPNGTLPLYNVTVYVPNGPIDAFPEGATCDQCGTTLSGNPLVKTLTDETGHFQLDDMPATGDVPLVVQVGKWRREITIPNVPQCTDTALVADQTRLPRVQAEGSPNDNIPRMALTTGGADALECLLRKIGIADSEFGVMGEADKRIHLYAGNATSAGGGTDKYDSSTDNGADFAGAQSLWGNATTAANLTPYDVVLLSCEGNQNTADKPTEALTALKSYADIGGRVFASHWHNYWVQQDWSTTATWNNDANTTQDITADVYTGVDKGQSLADGLVNVGASTTPAKIDIHDAKHTVTDVDESLVDTWIALDTPPDDSGRMVQYFSLTTPLEDDPEDRCGRVVFSDIHVSSGDGADSSQAALEYPSGGCTSDVAVLSPQEKVLAFMIFDIASCIGPVVP